VLSAVSILLGLSLEIKHPALAQTAFHVSFASIQFPPINPDILLCVHELQGE